MRATFACNCCVTPCHIPTAVCVLCRSSATTPWLVTLRGFPEVGSRGLLYFLRVLPVCGTDAKSTMCASTFHHRLHQHQLTLTSLVSCYRLLTANGSKRACSSSWIAGLDHGAWPEPARAFRMRLGQSTLPMVAMCKGSQASQLSHPHARWPLGAELHLCSSSVALRPALLSPRARTASYDGVPAALMALCRQGQLGGP